MNDNSLLSLEFRVGDFRVFVNRKQKWDVREILTFAFNSVFFGSMPRKSRIDAPGALHHIIIRGIERKPIFKDSRDYENFLQRLGTLFVSSSTPCYAWALMKNHVHVLIRTGSVPISSLMRRLLTGYAQQFNRRHKRHGHLFQNRYKSILCEEDNYLLELIRYIHLNPIRAGQVEDMTALKKYPWSGHAVVLGMIAKTWQDTAYVLRLFGEPPFSAREAYTRFVTEGIALGRIPNLVGGGLLRSMGGWSALRDARSAGQRIASDERILGSSDFVDFVLKQAQEVYETRTRTKLAGIDLDILIQSITDHFGLEPKIIKSSVKQRTASRARAILCCLAIDRCCFTGVAVARKLNLSPSAVSKLAERGRHDTLSQKIARSLFSVF
jgi:REP element-mobilizing transposase RayT